MNASALLKPAFVPSLCLALASPAAAAIHDTMLVTPESPTNEVPVSIRVSGWHSDGCWDPEVPHSCSRDGNRITVTFQSVDNWQPGVACPAVIQDFDATCELGLLPAGTYLVDVVESASTLRIDVPLSRQFGFEVTAAVADAESRWSTLKATFGRH